jgi:4-hydroxybenzoate polyprenyltransferase
MFRDLLTSMRPKQWSKNLIVFAGLFFAGDVSQHGKITVAVFTFVLFCLTSSSAYLINDIFDIEKDRLHPRKRHRPIAAGKVPVRLAAIVAMILLAAALYWSYRINYIFAVILSSYYLLTIFYSAYLKNIIIIDVMVIASGFMFRAIGGTIMVGEEPSSWLIICAIFLALFLALSKRRSEAAALGSSAINVRKTLGEYNSHLLDQMLNMVTAACLISYALYTLDPATVAKFGSRRLVFTLPFVIYGIFRYTYLVHNRNWGESPEYIILSDKPLLACILLYGISATLIIYL